MVNYLGDQTPAITVRITQSQYDEFMRHYVIDALAGKRLGQSFCERHGITNASPLYHFRDNNLCERWIRDNYITPSDEA
jgi:hypothetical protein